MKRADAWFAEYGESHEDRTNKAIHWVCIPLIVFSLCGMLWQVRLSSSISWLNAATVAAAVAMIYYLALSLPMALGMAVVFSGMLGGAAVVSSSSAPPWLIFATLFVAAWIGQFAGHRIEGKRPSFFKDIQFLLIGPLWLLGFVYRRLGIPY